MNRKINRLLVAPLLLGLSAAWAQDEPALPEPAADKARNAAQLPDEAANGLDISADKVENRPAEATIRLMNDADDDDADTIMHELELPTLPEQGANGYRGLDIAAEARENGGAFGQSTADEARDNAAAAAEEARERAEDRGRAEDLPPEVPGRPDLPDQVPDRSPGPPGS